MSIPTKQSHVARKMQGLGAEATDRDGFVTASKSIMTMAARRSLSVILLLVFSLPVWADYEQGMAAVKRGDYLTASKEFIAAAESGDPKAQTMLGLMYSGQFDTAGIVPDLARAVEQIKSAAQQGVPEAQYELGYMHHWGTGVPKDYSKEFKWLEKSAQQGLDLAQNYLGSSYYKGEGVKRDLAQALKWYRKSAEQGWVWGQFNLGEMYAHGEGVAQDNMRAYAWHSLAADQGVPRSKREVRRLSAYGQSQRAKEYRKELREKIAETVTNLGRSDFYPWLNGPTPELVPIPESIDPLVFKGFVTPPPPGRPWSLGAFIHTEQKDISNYTQADFTTVKSSDWQDKRLLGTYQEVPMPRTLATIFLVNLEERRFETTKQFFKYVKKSKAIESIGHPRPKGIKYKYKLVKGSDKTCVRYTLADKLLSLPYVIGRGFVCIHPHASSVAAVAEYHHQTDDKLSDDGKKLWAARADEFLSGIELTPIE